MSTNRYALLFKPGVYGSAGQPLQLRVGYYTELAGLGALPTDVTINGKIEVYNRCLDDGGTSNCLALVNFWRTLSNLSLHIDALGQDGCRASANFWAVSQAVSMRRLDIAGGNLSLMRSSSGDSVAPATEPSPPASETAAASRGVDGPPAIAACTIGNRTPRSRVSCVSRQLIPKVSQADVSPGYEGRASYQSSGRAAERQATLDSPAFSRRRRAGNVARWINTEPVSC